MAAHRKPSRRQLGGPAVRTAATLALAGAASATAFDGTGHADPAPTADQVRAKVDRLYQEAETATQSYDGAREQVRAAERRLTSLRDEAARREADLNSARDTLGSIAAAQYRSAGLDPSVQLALSGRPDRFLEDAALAERAGDRQSEAVRLVRQRLREVERLRGAARVEVASLAARQTELRGHQRTVTEKLDAARLLLSRLTAAERARVEAGEAGGAGAAGAGRAARSVSASGRAGLDSAAQAPDSRAAAAVSYAYSKLGSPYVWGATGPSAFDCSGLVQAAYRAAGISLPRTTYAQIGAGRRVPRSELRPGDLVFFYSGISHVGLYIGDGRMIHAPNPSAPVRVAPIDQMPFAGATRVV